MVVAAQGVGEALGDGRVVALLPERHDDELSVPRACTRTPGRGAAGRGRERCRARRTRRGPRRVPVPRARRSRSSHRACRVLAGETARQRDRLPRQAKHRGTLVPGTAGRRAQPSSIRFESGPSRRRERRDTPGSSNSLCVGAASDCSALELLGGDRAPALVDHGLRLIVGDRLHVDLEVLRPQPQPRLASEIRVVGDDVHLGVVEQRVGVEVGRADGEPAVVDDPDLGVHVQGIVAVAAARADRGREEAPGAVIGCRQLRQLAERVVVAVVGAPGKQDHQPEVVAGRIAELVGEDADDLRRPQELVFEIDEALGTPKRAHIALEDAELALGHRVVHHL